MSREGFAEAHIPGAVNIPVEELEDRVSEVSRIMSQHNGEVKVKSQPGITEFEIYFRV
jgi:3-mercaptopyruvate sulfurtransferase SseA